MNLAIKSFGFNLHEMNSLLIGVITLKHGIFVETFFQDTLNLHR
jgi:hypothetical protein